MKMSMRTFLFILIMFPISISAQKPKQQMKEEVEKIRKNVYTRVLILSDTEAEKFWPVFNKMQDEIEGVRKQMEAERKKVNDNYASLTDQELDNSIKKMMELEQQQLDIRKRYYEEFKKVLPIKKVALLPRAEREFKKELLQKVKEHRQGPPPEDE